MTYPSPQDLERINEAVKSVYPDAPLAIIVLRKEGFEVVTNLPGDAISNFLITYLEQDENLQIIKGIIA